MKRRILPMGLLLVLIVLLGAALYGTGNYVVYLLAYVFSFALLLCYTAAAPCALPEKAAQAAVYALILAAQILYAVLIMRPACGDGQSFALYRLSGVLIILAPFLIRQLWRPRA